MTDRTSYVPTPPTDPALYRAWRQGAADEQKCSVEGMTDDNRPLFDFVHVLATQGRSKDHITELTAMVFTASWSRRDRLRLAVRLLTRIPTALRFRR